jgi:hypothetical protein
MRGGVFAAALTSPAADPIVQGQGLAIGSGANQNLSAFAATNSYGNALGLAVVAFPLIQPPTVGRESRVCLCGKVRTKTCPLFGG